MTGKIFILPEEMTNKIAAGEVIERPASIVKELLENSIDAGATEITVELGKGGCGSIRVVDNGEGIEHADVPLAFERHATSKIYRLEDLLKIKSYGFRGEALPSIASISRVEMVTRKKTNLSGTRIIIEAGQMKEITEAGCPAGTSIFVSRIFEPVPVRKRYLKSEATEQGHCVDVITKAALANYHIKFRVVADGKDILNFPSVNNFLDRIPLVLGEEIMDKMLPVDLTLAGIVVRGVVSSPHHTRSSTRQMYFFVNGRYIRDYHLHHAVMSACRSLIDVKRYPLTVLFIEIPKDDIDVNVHPAKLEVRFRKPKDIYDTTVAALKSALSRTAHAGEKKESSNSTLNDHRRFNDQGSSSGIQDAIRRYTISSGSGKLLFDHANYGESSNYGAISTTTDSDKIYEDLIRRMPSASDISSFRNLEFMGQIENQYLVLSSTNDLVIIDQHAAHERILFEKFKQISQKEINKTPSQRLLIPEVVSLSPPEFSSINDYIEIFNDIGYEIEPFGGNSVIIKSVPADLYQVNIAGTISDSIEEIATTGKTSGAFAAREKILKLLSCKGAVKLNRKLTKAEVYAMLENLDAVPHNTTCPHGRPIYVLFGFAYLSKLFKRK